MYIPSMFAERCHILVTFATDRTADGNVEMFPDIESLGTTTTRYETDFVDKPEEVELIGIGESDDWTRVRVIQQHLGFDFGTS